MIYLFPAFAAALTQRGFKIHPATLRNRLLSLAPPEAVQSATSRWTITVDDENHLLRLAEKLAGPREEG